MIRVPESMTGISVGALLCVRPQNIHGVIDLRNA